MPVSSIPRSVGRSGLGSTASPSCAAIASTAASACCAAMPPCLIGNVVASPAAYTSFSPVTRPCSSMGMKPCSSQGRPGTSWPSSLGQRDHLLDLQRVARVEAQLAAVDPLRLHTGPERDAAVREQVAEHAAGRRPEQRERIRLGARHGQLDADHAGVGQMRSGQQRELVQGQRPVQAGGVDEGQTLNRAGHQPLEHGSKRVHVSRSAEVQRSLQPLAPAGAERDQQRVVGEASAPPASRAHRPWASTPSSAPSCSVAPCSPQELGELEQRAGRDRRAPRPPAAGRRTGGSAPRDAPPRRPSAARAAPAAPRTPQHPRRR